MKSQLYSSLGSITNEAYLLVVGLMFALAFLGLFPGVFVVFINCQPFPTALYCGTIGGLFSAGFAVMLISWRFDQEYLVERLQSKLALVQQNIESIEGENLAKSFHDYEAAIELKHRPMLRKTILDSVGEIRVIVSETKSTLVEVEKLARHLSNFPLFEHCKYKLSNLSLDAEKYVQTIISIERDLGQLNVEALKNDSSGELEAAINHAEAMNKLHNLSGLLDSEVIDR